ncbi:MAG: oxidoreductase [Bacteroidetes bacterium]|nr:MAG: oxidoreductase [Bacteroidota bacterium]
MREIFPVKVKENLAIAPNAWLLAIPRTFDFVAGQVIGISLNKKEVPRLYSIASGIHQNEIGILYTRKEDGLLTPPLSKCKKGDTLFITKPFGNFICKEEEAVWIATGTGIAPFASMLLSGQYHGKTLIQGNRDQTGLYFSDLFKEKMKTHYHPCCSRESADGCFLGRVTDFLQNQPHIKTDIPYYLCGIAEMVVDVRDILISKGVPFSKINSEIFF